MSTEKRKRLQEKWHIALYLLFLACTVVLVISTIFTHEDYKIMEYEGLSFEQPWTYTYANGVTGETELPGKLPTVKNCDQMTLTNTLPTIPDSVSLLYRARHCTVQIYLDDVLIIDNTNQSDRSGSWFPLVGNIYHELHLSEKDTGKEIKIVNYCSSEKYLAGPGVCYLGDRGSLFLNIIGNRWVTIFCSITLFLLAFVLIFSWFVLKFSVEIQFPEGLCLGLFTLSIAVWMATETHVIQFIMKDTKFVTVLAFEDLMLIPVPIALFFYFASQNESTKKASKHVSSWPLILWLVNNSLHFLKIVPLQDSLIITQIMILVELTCIAFIQIRDLVITSKVVKDEISGRYWRIPIVGIAILVPLAGVETVKYMFDNGSNKFDGLFISLGILVYIMSLALASTLQLSHRTIRLQAETETKSQFLANMSHEIRTPLNAILGYGEMILRDTKEEKTRGYASNIQNAGDTLRNIINSILDITKIESGKLEIYSVEYNTVQMIDHVMSVTEALAKKKDLIFIADIDDRIPETLIGDENHIMQIIMNLTNNAVKYTETGSVTLTVKLLEMSEESPMCKLYVSIQDTGIGIKEEDKGRLFEKFERLDQGKNYNVEGTGLGMSIVVNLLKAMGSKIEVESEYGKGSNFFFVLEQCTVGKNQIGSFAERRKELMDAQIATADFIAPRAKILVVDDLEMNLNVVCDLLAPQRMQIDRATSGKGAIALVKQNEYDVILMDHMMPEMDGIEATQKIRDLAMEYENAYFAMVPILALTANAMVGMKDSFIQAGMQDFISKPVELPTLLKALKKWLPKDKIEKIDPSELKEKEEAVQKGWDIGEIDGIDLSVAEQFNSSQKMYEKNLKDYYLSLESTKEHILALRDEKDAVNYKIAVHGLKSVSKIIGAMELSEKCLELETCCIDQKFEEACEKTPELEVLINQYLTSLGAFLQIDTSTVEEQECCSMDEYLTIIRQVREAAENFDMGAFMELEETLGNLVPPLECSDDFQKIKEDVKNASFMDVANMISEKYGEKA